MDGEPLMKYLKGEMSFEAYQQTMHTITSQDTSSANNVNEMETEDVATTTESMKPSSSHIESPEPDVNAANIQEMNMDDLIIKYVAGEVSFNEFNDELERRQENDNEVPQDMFDVSSVQDLEQRDSDDQDPSWKPSSAENSDDSDDSHVMKTEIKEPVKAKAKRGRPRKIRNQLPPSLAGLMGEANLKYARGMKEEAMRMILEVIRQAPRNSVPYRTLSMIYEEMGDTTKYIQYAMVAAHLGADGPDEWLKLADLALERDNVTEAISCHTKAIQLVPRNRELYERRAALYKRNGEERRYLDDMKCAAVYLPSDRADEAVERVRNIAAIFMEEYNEPGKSADTMQMLLTTRPSDCSIEDINYLIEYILCNKDYLGAFTALVEHCNVQLEVEKGRTIQGQDAVKVCKRSLSTIKRVVLSESFHIDLQGKLLCSAIHVHLSHAIEELVCSLRQQDVEEYGDIMLDVSEAYMANRLYKQAKPILEQLQQTPSFNQAAVWLSYGDCLRALNEFNGAAAAYRKVIELAPSHVSARLSLAAMLQQLGETQEAAQTLEHDEQLSHGRTASLKEVRLLVQRCHVFASLNKGSSLIAAVKRLLYAGFWSEKHTDQYKSVIRYSRAVRRMTELKHFLEQPGASGQSINPPAGVLDDIWELYVKVHDHCIEGELWEDLLEVSILMLLIPKFSEEQAKKCKIEFTVMITCSLTGDDVTAFELLRPFCIKDPTNVQAFNVLSQLTAGGNHSKHERFCYRLLQKNPHVPHLCMLNGHTATTSGSYKHALAEYQFVHQKQPDDALSCLCIATTYVNIAFGKGTSQKHQVVLQGLSYMCRYLRLRGPCQEAYFNVARALQQANLTHLAVHYYNKVLEVEPCVKGNNMSKFDLRPEAAYNLSMMYQNSGSIKLASYIANKYIVI